MPENDATGCRPRLRREVEECRLPGDIDPECCSQPPKYSLTTAVITLSVVPTLERGEEEGECVWNPHLHQNLSRGGPVGVHQFERSTRDFAQPAHHVDHHRKEHDERHHCGAGPHVLMGNQLFMIGATAMIGAEFTAIANGIIPSRMIGQRDVSKAIVMPPVAPMAKPIMALRIVSHPAETTTSNCSTNTVAIRLGRGSRNVLMSNTITSSFPRAMPNKDQGCRNAAAPGSRRTDRCNPVTAVMRRRRSAKPRAPQ